MNGLNTNTTKVDGSQTTLNEKTVHHENYISNSEWLWDRYSYEVKPITATVRNNQNFSQEFVQKVVGNGTLHKWYLNFNIQIHWLLRPTILFKFLKLIIQIQVKRNQPFYTLTLFVPILLLTMLSPIGLILPGNTTVPFRKSVFYPKSMWVTIMG